MKYFYEYWMIVFLVGVFIVSAQSTYGDYNLEGKYKEHKLHHFKFFAYIWVSVVLGGSFVAGIKEQEIPLIMVILIPVVWYILIFITLWVETKKEKSIFTNIKTKTILSLYLLATPYLVILHTHNNFDMLKENVGYYNSWLDNGRGGAPAIKLVKNQVISDYTEIVYLNFIRTIELKCGKNDTKCVRFRNRFDRYNNNNLFQFGRFVFYFFSIFSILSYLGRVLEIKFDLSHGDAEGLGLQKDVLKHSSKIIAGSISLILSLSLGGVQFAQLGIFAGLVGAGLSIAFKDLLSNLLSGAMMLWDGTIKKGDVITLKESTNNDTGSTYGIVKSMRMRYTVIEDRNTVRRLVPNSVLTNSSVENWTHEDNRIRLHIDVSVAYGTDVKQAKHILESACYEISRINLEPNPPQAVISGLGDSAVLFSLRFWITDAAKGIRPILSELYVLLLERFEDAGIAIPYAQLDIHMKDERVPK